MLRSLRSPSGGPALRVRVIAALVAVGLLALSAPIAVVIVRAVLDLLL